MSSNVFAQINVVEPYVPPTKIPRPKSARKHKSEMNFQKIANTYPTIVCIKYIGKYYTLLYVFYVSRTKGDNSGGYYVLKMLNNYVQQDC
jgi:hypothetical protein